MKNNFFKTMALVFITGAFTLFGCGSSEEKPAIDCKTREDYKYGFEAGKGEAKNKYLGMDYSGDCDTYLRNANNGAGMVGDVSDCWREGFYNGFNDLK